MADSIGLADFLYRIKQELMQSEPDGNNDELPRLLMIEDVEVEIQVGVTRQASGGIDVQVVKLGGGAKREDTHTVRVKLQPILSHDQRLAELRRDPRWEQWSQQIIHHTTKSASGAPTQRED
jgi:Trypsin-co-occurring domain 2